MQATNVVGCSVIWELFKLSTPVMLGMLLQALFAMVDLYFVARLGTANASAIAIGGSAFGTIISMTVLVTSATMAIGARAYGAKDMPALKRYGALTALLSAALGLVLGIALVLWQAPLMNWLYQPTAETAKPLGDYLGVIFAGLSAFFIAANGRALLQATGDTWTPLWVFGLANVANAILDPIFIFDWGFGMGIAGAALATVIANVIAALWLYGIIVKRIYGGSWAQLWKSATITWSALKSIFEIGFWDALQAVARPVTGMLMFSLVYQMGGDAATAAFGIGGQLFNYTFIVLAGLSVSIGIFAGQAAGQGRLEDLGSLVRQAFIVACVNMLVFAIPYLLLQRQLFGIFTQDPMVLQHGQHYLSWVYPGVCFVVLPTIFGGVFKGVGATKQPMVASMTANVALKLPLAWLLSTYTPLGIDGVWAAISLSVVVEAAIIGLYYYLGKWREMPAYSNA